MIAMQRIRPVMFLLSFRESLDKNKTTFSKLEAMSLIDQKPTYINQQM